MSFPTCFFMRKLSKTYIKNLNRERTNPGILNKVTENPYEKLAAELQVGCWYRGKVVGHNHGNPVVSISSKHCKINLKGCNEEVQKGDLVIFEVTRTIGYLSSGAFREVFSRVKR